MSNRKLTFENMDDKIKLYSCISTILNESNNTKLADFCKSYLNKIDSGVKECNLYESFISGVSNWNFINPVETELSALVKRIDKYKQEIDLTKIVNVMKQTDSAYLVPLIEEVVLDYMNNKSAGNRAILKDRLMCFHHDAFIKEMLNVLYYDKSVNESIKRNIVNNKITYEKIYSPIFLVKENECIFNVKGQYYSRKGNNINRLPKAEYAGLDESFVNLCNIINSNNISINEHNNTIELVAGNKVAVISEGAIMIDDVAYTIDAINENMNVSSFLNDGYATFYSTILTLVENFNNITNIDFVSRITLNENKKISTDVFRLKESIFITTHDDLGRHTFYRNVNPIQTANIINEHMNLNVSDLFEDLQPNQKRIKNEISDTCRAYEECIKEFNKKKAELEACAEGANSADAAAIKEALKMIEAELEKTENDYKEYQQSADKFLNGEDGEVQGDDAAFDTDGADNGDTDDADVFGAEDDVENTDDVDINDLEASVSEPMTDDAPTEYDGIFDETPVANEIEDEYAPKVVKVSYKTNIKTGEVSNNGEVHVLIPSVNGDGDITNELQKITFTLNSDKSPIINNEYMPVTIYNIIKSAIEADPVTSTIDVGAASSVDSVPTIDDNADVFTDADDDSTDSVDHGDDNPIDVVYGTTDVFTDADDAEPSDIKTEIGAEYDEVEPTATDEPEGEDLEAVVNIHGLVTLDILDAEISHEGIDKAAFIDYLHRHGIAVKRIDNGISVYIRNSEHANKLKAYFIGNEMWSEQDFYQFFNELKIYESAKNVVVAYSPAIEQILEGKSLPYKVSKRGDKLMIKNAIMEGVIITVKDDKTNKTVTINTDELNDDADKEAKEAAEKEPVTFDSDDNSQAIDNETDSDDKSEESNESGGDSERKFVFRVKKQATNESLGETIYESHNANDVEVGEVVKYKGKTGQIISKMSNNDIIVTYDGTSEIIRPSQVRIVANEPNIADFDTTPEIKDPLHEQVACGIFMNDFRISPSGCTININEYNAAKADDNVTLIIEGRTEEVAKKYVKLL